jgi:hypothetical protein
MRAEVVPILHGLTAHLLATPADYGGPILWWVQEGTPVALSGPDLDRDDLVRIAALPGMWVTYD